MWMLLSLGCPKDAPPEESAGPTVGWTIEEGWNGACFVPPDFTTLTGEVKQKQQRDTVTALASQWVGQRNDGVRFDEEAAQSVAALLQPAEIEEVARENLGFCRDFMSGAATTAAWSSWLEQLADDLERQNCPEPLEDTYLTLDVGEQWFAVVPLCQGDGFFVKSGSDLYKTRPDNDFHDVNGVDGDASSLPCPECPVGALIGRIDGDDGSSTVFALGAHYAGTAEVGGTLSIGLNDDDVGDNTYRVQGGVTDSVGIQVGPSR